MWTGVEMHFWITHQIWKNPYFLWKLVADDVEIWRFCCQPYSLFTSNVITFILISQQLTKRSYSQPGHAEFWFPLDISHNKKWPLSPYENHQFQESLSDCQISEDAGAAIPLLLYAHPHCTIMVHHEDLFRSSTSWKFIMVASIVSNSVERCYFKEWMQPESLDAYFQWVNCLQKEIDECMVSFPFPITRQILVIGLYDSFFN